jgi:hypothetical protein
MKENKIKYFSIANGGRELNSSLERDNGYVNVSESGRC